MSTAVYPELTSRLAMSIDGATQLDDVGPHAWRELAAEIGFAPRFLEQRMGPFVERVGEAVVEVASALEHHDPIVREIAPDIAERISHLR